MEAQTMNRLTRLLVALVVTRAGLCPGYNAPMADIQKALKDQAFAEDYAALYQIEKGAHQGMIGDVVDDGGPTVDGITRKWWGHLWDHWPPTKAERLIFWRDRWDQWKLYERIHDPVLRREVFEFAANADFPDAVTALQCALRGVDILVQVDTASGTWGPEMDRVMPKVQHHRLLPGFKAAVARHYFGQPKFAQLKKGWLNRLAPLPAD